MVARRISDLRTVLDDPVFFKFHPNKVFEFGHINRATECTYLNEHSSRSHALLMVTVRGVNYSTGIQTTGKLNLVDLAGSERVGKSGAEGSRLREAQYINKSLLALGDVIHALRSRQGYIPFRNSKLTYLLQDSLSGESKTLMMVHVSPVEKNTSETLCSLKFAERVRSVELGHGTRRSESGSWSSQEHLEVTVTLAFTPHRGASCPPYCVPASSPLAASLVNGILQCPEPPDCCVTDRLCRSWHFTKPSCVFHSLAVLDPTACVVEGVHLLAPESLSQSKY
uniref:Uncharacterized protein n=1 Tax=Sphaerodactylus townsendi TaxID=933632 RepID=A0ACB8E698_9SAUR